MNSTASKTLLVAIGSPHGDDRVAWDVADLLASRLPGTVSTKKASVPVNMIDWIDGVKQLHIIDACDGGGQSGSLLRCEWQPDSSNGWPGLERGTSETPEASTQACRPPRHPSQAQSHPGHPFNLRGAGSHDFDVVSVLELARTLNRLPERIIIWGIVGKNFEPSDELSSELQSQMSAIANVIREEVTDAREISGAVAADSG
ncbi:MAG: hypothetical protein WAO83_06630 [Fuerstiella sp.]